MPDDINFDVTLDAQGYVVGAAQIAQANTKLNQSFSSLALQTVGIQKALDLVTPKRAVVVGFAGAAKAAADAEQSFSTFAATATTTGASYGKLTDISRSLAREFPIGGQAARQLVGAFTQMGVAGAGTEVKISKLSRTIADLSGATGEGPQQLAEGMTQLARATGNTSLDPARFSKMADSVTQVSASSGASATSILAFSKNIAPFAQAAGIGTTSILGISGAFAKMGEDGAVASNAVSKMMSDLNRSVREGSPEMKTYAQFAGMTADNFEKLFKSNPAEALTKVTDAIGKAGPEGQRMLEMIGIEGVRGQRALAGVTAAGGMTGLMRESKEAYGQGATSRAAEAAFGGFNDSVLELTETSKQLAEALGTPLLGPLTAFADALKVPTNMARSVAESGFVQKTLQVGAGAAIAFMVAKSVAGPLAAFGIGRQAATSSPMRALFAGMAGRDTGTFASRFGAPVNELYEKEGVYGRGMAAGPAARMYSMGEGIRRARMDRMKDVLGEEGFNEWQQRRTARMEAGQGPNEPRGGPSPLSRVRRNVFSYTSMLAEAYGNTLNQQYGDASRPIGERGSRTASQFGFPQRATDASEAAREQWKAGGGIAGGFTNIKKTLDTFNKEMTESASAVKEGTSAVKAHGKALWAAARTGTAGLGDARRAGGAMIGGLARQGFAQAGGAVGVGIGAAVGAYEVKQMIDSNNEEARKAWSGRDISEALNTYRESIGKATGPMVSMGSQSDAMAKSLAQATKTLDQAVKVTPEDVTAAKGEPLQKYIGTPEQVAAQIGAVATSQGMTPDELQAVKVDLLRAKRPQGEVEKIMSQVAGYGGVAGQGGVMPGNQPEMGKQIVDALSKQGNQGGLVGFFNKMQTMPMPGMTNWNAPNAAFYGSAMSDEARQRLQSYAGTITERKEAQGKEFGADYAKQEQLRTFDETYAQAIASGNVDLVSEMSKEFTKQLGGEKGEMYVHPEDVEKYGSFTKAYEHANADFRKGQEEFTKRQQEAGGQFKPGTIPGYTSDILKNVSSVFSQSFDQTLKGSPVNQAFQASMLKPGDVGKQNAAAEAFVANADKTGKTLAELGVEAQKAAGGVSAMDQSYKIILATQQKLETEMSRRAIDKTQTQVGLERYEYLRGIANTAPTNNPELEAKRTQADQESIVIREGFKQQMVARLQMQRQYEVQVTRMNEDFGTTQVRQTEDYEIQRDRTLRNYNTGRTRSIEDFGRQQSRTIADFNKNQARNSQDFYRGQARNEFDFRRNVVRATEDYNKGRKRSHEDYQLSVLRSTRDFNTEMERGQADFYKTQLRANRDFNISIQRQVEDAAKNIYDPYARIQTKATWDAKNLLVNLKEQNEAIAKQKQQLDELRRLGVSSQVIDQLQLGKSENAQQVNNLVQDLSKDQSLVGQLNQTAGQRATLTGEMFFDESNVELKRSREDFQKSLADQETDYRTSVERSRADMAKNLADQAQDFAKSLARSAEDFNTNLKRQNEDYRTSVDRANQDFQIGVKRSNEDLQTGLKRSNEDFHISLQRSEHDLNVSLGDMETDFNRSMNRQAEDFNKQLRRMHEDLRRADEVIAGDFKTIMEQTNKAIHGQAVEWNKVIGNEMQTLLDGLKTKVVPEMNSIAAGLGITLPGAQQTQQGYANKYAAMDKAQGYEEGGVIGGVSPHKKADDKLIRATSGEFMQPVDSVQYYGTDRMEKIRRRAIPIGAFDGYAEGGPIGRATKDGQTVDTKTYSIITEAEKLLHWAIRVTQGSWSTRVAASGGTHAGAGASDLVPSGSYPATVGALRSKGGIAWHRTPAQGPWIQHIHMAVPVPGMSPGLASQVAQYMKGGDGLGGRDPGPPVNFQGLGDFDISQYAGVGGGAGFVPRPKVDWTKAFAGFDNKSTGGWYAPLRDQFKVKIREHVEELLDRKYGKGGIGADTPAYTAGGGAEQWRGLGEQVLSLLRRPAGEIGALLRRINAESGGNPRAINLWDSNAKAGIPSKGLMQTIDPTFRAYRNPNFSSDIYDPLANIYAGSNYAVKRYGSIAAIDPLVKKGGYDDGGKLKPGQTLADNGTGKTEAVLTSEQWAAVSTLAEMGSRMVSAEQGKQLTAAGGIHLTIDRRTITNDHRTDMTGAQITVVAQDPEELGMKLRQKEWLSRATQTRGVNRA